MTSDFRLQLSCLEGRVGLMGVGNVELSDDGFGVRLAEQLIWDGAPNVIVAGTNPERYLWRCDELGFDHLIFLDAVEFGGEPGSVVFLNGEEIEARFAQISTHKLSLGLLSRCVEANGKTRAWLLGAQPATLRHSCHLSPSVHETVEVLAELLEGHFSAATSV